LLRLLIRSCCFCEAPGSISPRKGENELSRLLKKFFAIILFFSIIISLLGCEDEQAVLKGKVESYNVFVDRVNSAFVSEEETDISLFPLMKEFEQADPAKKSKMALDLADDMAFAEMFGLTTDEVLLISGNAAKAYPHPLLLNNYATMLLGRENTEDALYFYKLALNQEPDNAILLTNIANLFIELDDFAAAERYAGMALQAAGDFGPAYQVLTTVHLYNDNSELAAETMVKSARHVFNDVTIHHFDSFLDAVADLNPMKDEYPLKEIFLNELYEIARNSVENDDVKENVDTPEGQLQIQPFPALDSLEGWGKYLRDEMDKSLEMWSIASHESMKYRKSYKDNKELDSLKEGTYPIEFNIRQEYALRVLESYYKFKLEKVKGTLLKKDEQLRKQLSNQRSSINDAFEPQYKAAVDKTRTVAKEAIRSANIDAQSIKVAWAKAKFDAFMHFVNQRIRLTHDYYTESKQILEEFWLKSGGLLKYIIEADLFNSLNAHRKMIAYEYSNVVISKLSDIASEFEIEKIGVTFEQALLDGMISEADSLNMPSPVEEEEKLVDLVAKIGDKPRELDAYPEPGAWFKNLQIGLEGGFFGNSVSASANKKSYDMSVDTVVGARGWDGNFATDTHRSYTLHGVKAVTDSKWYSDTNLVKGYLEDTLGKDAAKSLGKIGIGYVDTDREGPYMTTRGRTRTILDKGRIRVKETGWGFGPVEKTNKTEIVRSTMTGFSATKNSVKYKFGFVTASWDE